MTDAADRSLDPLHPCRAEDARHLVGRVADAGTVDVARRLTRSTEVRVLRPADARSSDYRTARLNLDVDEAGKIVRVYCG